MKAATKKATKKVVAKKATKKITKKATKARPAAKAKKTPARKAVKKIVTKLSALQNAVLSFARDNGFISRDNVGAAFKPYPTRIVRTLIDKGLLLGDPTKVARISAAGKRYEMPVLSAVAG
jgi:hypothetical protein